jgi:DNA-binding transcriptional MocR family regulator
MLPRIQIDETSDHPIYRQIYAQLRSAILGGTLEHGERLPATRELAGQLGLNRQTISTAYELLESDALVRGEVGRGSFVIHESPAAAVTSSLNWTELLASANRIEAPPLLAPVAISFANSRPSELLFPLEQFRATCEEVIRDANASSILQLGSPAGYASLRAKLFANALAEGAARDTDDVVITNGCQQSLDLIQRILCTNNGSTVLIEDPVYSGLRNVFVTGGTRVVGVPVGVQGIDLDALARAIQRERPRALVVTPNFQNPTGATLPLAARQAILRLTREARVVLIEHDIYGELRYRGEALPTIKQLDDTGDTILLRSFSKLAFPGLRVGWAIGPKVFTRRLTEAKQSCDLHTDQLSQAVLLRFLESGRLADHRRRMIEAGGQRLDAALHACERYLPQGSRFTRPEGGMNLWVELPEGIDAGEMLARAQREGVSYLPGRYFSVSRDFSNCFRISFAGVAPDRIRQGLEILGSIYRSEWQRVESVRRLDTQQPALV